jgi:hypothetical protein
MPTPSASLLAVTIIIPVQIDKLGCFLASCFNPSLLSSTVDEKDGNQQKNSTNSNDCANDTSNKWSS